MKLSPQIFVILADVVEQRAGLHYGPHEIEVFSEKILARAAEAGFESPLDYYYYIRYDPAAEGELDALIEALVVGETYFFREFDALRTIVDQYLKPVLEKRGHARVWCAACASGEEPLTLAMLLDDRGLLGRTEIVATDISPRALTKARSGVFSHRAARMLPSEDADITGLSRHLTRTDHDVRIDPRFIDAISFRRVNLLDDDAVTALGRFDFVICRNVLIYFSDITVRDVVQRLINAMTPEGRLLVGASESLLRFGTSMRCEEKHGSFFYAKGQK